MARRRISRLRTGKSLRRRAGQRPPRSITLIVCEGETERLYFEVARAHFGLTTAEIVIAHDIKGSAPVTVVAVAEAKCAQPGGYDNAFCVFDRDAHESFQRARERIKYLRDRSRDPLPIHEVISIPCFEVWVLLHFEQRDAPFASCAEAVQRIRHAHLHGYETASEEVMHVLLGRHQIAVANAEWLEKRAAANNYNPFTAVHVVMRHLAYVATKPQRNL